MSRVELALGTAQLGQDYGVANEMGRPDTELQALSLLDEAYRAGVTTWDTAPAYGTSEQIIGRYVRETSRRPRIATKLPALIETEAPPPRGSDLPRCVRRQARESLEVLSVDKIDFYLVHDPEMFRIYGEELVAALRELQDEGLIERIGLSVYSPDEALAWLRTAAGATLQIPCNLFDHRFKEVLDVAMETNSFVFARSVFLQGLFFLEPEAAEEVVPDGGELVSTLRGIAREADRSVAELALCYVRDLTGVDVVVVGLETEEQLAKNLQYFQAAPLRGFVSERLEAAFSDLSKQVFDPRRWESA